MRVLWILLALLGAALAGCADEAPDEPTPQMEQETIEGEAPPPLFGPHSGLPLRRADDWRPSLDEPPQWVLGEWWQVRAVDGFVGTEHEITRVVAGKEGNDYLVGMPIDQFNDEIMVLHHPGMGLVQSDTLGYETHDWMYQLLQFPLTVGDTWDSLWQAGTNTVTHVVESIDEEAMTATITTTGGNSATYVYDANLGVISEWHSPGYMSWEVVAHGFDHEGTVRVPHGHDMHIFHGRVGPVLPMQLSQGAIQSATGTCIGPVLLGCVDVAPPIETFTVPEGYDRGSFSIIILDLVGQTATGQLGAPAVGGAYSVSGSAPDGTTFELTQLPSDGFVSLQSYAVEDPVGEWNLQTVAVGGGAAFIEGVVYVTFDVVLPEGCVILTENVHDHGGECGGHVHDIS